MLNKLPSSHEREVAKWEATNAERRIMEWQKHILRGTQQAKARSKSFMELGHSNALWIRDYAQKVNPSKTLESMTEYFGKRGITVSVEVFFMKAFGSYHKQVYLVGVDRSDQGTLDTLCIADTVLEQFHQDNPHITEIDLKSDNAANYHANGVPECMHTLAKNRGITFRSYNYNEAQLGKDQCDREAAFFKKCADTWLLKIETNKISTATELAKAIFADGGPKNTKMCVVQIDKSLAKFDGAKKISNISYYHSVTFQDNGAFYREYYDVGVGKFYKFNDFNFVNGASFLLEWTNSSRQDVSMSVDHRNLHRSFPCTDTLCILEFKNQNDLLRHVEAGSHNYVKLKNNMDRAIFYYALKKDICNVSVKEAASMANEDDDVDSNASYINFYSGGWARKVRKTGRLTQKQKQFIEKLFHQGESTKSKLSAEQMSEKMKSHMVDGKYYFTPDEYLQVSQIRSLISRLKQNYEPQQKHHALLEDDGIKLNLDEICDEATSHFELESDDEDFCGF